VRCWFALQLAASSAEVLICWLLGLRLALRESPVAARHTTTRARMCLRARLRVSERAPGNCSRIVSVDCNYIHVSEAFGNTAMQ
jgi:hypothetical protein